MFQYTIGRVRCWMGRHQRSRSKARLVDGCYRSRCVFCKRAMREGGPDGWQLDDGPAPGKNSGRQLDLE